MSIRTHVSENVNKIVKRKDFTGHFGDLHSLLTSKDLETEFSELVGLPVSSLAVHHFHALTEIMLALNREVLKVIAGKRVLETSNTSIESREKINVYEMTSDSKGKVRYCGAWAIAKVMNSCRQYFKSNIYSSDKTVRMKAKEEYRKSELLVQMTWSSSTAEKQSKYKDTLNVTLSRKYQKGSLIHINDDVFEWILELEQERINILNAEMLSIHQEDFVENALKILTGNDRLIQKWKDVVSFHCLNHIIPAEVADLSLQLFKTVVTRYLKMGIGEFLREYRRDFKLQKTEAHRKKVVEKKNKKDLTSSKVTLRSMKEDASASKKNSHQRLQVMVNDKETIFHTTVYSKSEIQLLCKAYGVVFKKNDNKVKLSDKLIPKIRNLHNIPFPHVIDERLPHPEASSVVVRATSTSVVSPESFPDSSDDQKNTGNCTLKI